MYVAYQAPLSMGFSRQEYWSGLPFPSPRDHANPGVKPRSPSLQAGALPFELLGKPKALGAGNLSVLYRSSLNVATQNNKYGNKMLTEVYTGLLASLQISKLSPQSIPTGQKIYFGGI